MNNSKIKFHVDNVGLESYLHQNEETQTDNVSDITLNECKKRKKTAVSFKVHPVIPKSRLSESDIDTHWQYKHLIHSTCRLQKAINHRDIESLVSVIDELFTELCALKTVALREPKFGKIYILEMFKSMMRCSVDLKIEFSNYTEKDINGYKVLCFSHTTNGIFLHLSVSCPNIIMFLVK